MFAGVRRAESIQELNQYGLEKLVPLHLDVTDQQSIGQAVIQVEAQLGAHQLVGLVNNAGIVAAGPLEYLPMQAMNKQLEVNVMGPFAVTQAFLPLLRSHVGRIINIGSIAGRSTLPYTGPYNASKHALVALNDALRMELKPWGIKVVLIEPGVIKTPIWHKSLQAADDWAISIPEQGLERYGYQLNKVRQYALDSEKRGSEARQVVLAIKKALQQKRPKSRYIVGLDARARLMLEKIPDRWKDWIVNRVLNKDK